MTPEERPSRFRWFKKFIRTDAEQPCGTARMLLSFLRANQWVLFERNAPETMQIFACMKKEVMPKLESAEAELKVSQALGLEGSSVTQLTNSRADIPLLLPEGRSKPEEPWAARKILVDKAGTPVAIGEPEPQLFTTNILSYLETSNSVRAAHAPKQAEIKAPPPDEPPQPKDYRVVRIFYATDRARKGKGYSNQREPNDSLHLGTCDVTLPADHRMGYLESPRWWKFQFTYNPKKHVVLQGMCELAEPVFFGRLRSELLNAEQRSVLVFIHGYCVSFEDGARRTAQLSYDLGFSGAPILYSWPSAASLPAYPASTGP